MRHGDASHRERPALEQVTQKRTMGQEIIMQAGGRVRVLYPDTSHIEHHKH